MSLKHAILAVLSHGDRTGYDLTRKIDGSVGNFWPATHQQIYGELKNLDKLGFVRFKEKEQKGKPDKKVYKITKFGLDELKEWSSIPLELVANKDALLIKVFASHVVGTESLIAELTELSKLHQAKLSEYLAIEKEHFFKKVPPEYLGQYMTLRRGILFEKSWLEWCEESLRRLRSDF